MRHGGQRSRRFMRRLMERMAHKRLIAMGREAQRRKEVFDVDMTRPQPCVKAKEQTDAELAMKLAEEVQEVTAAMKAFDCATRENAYCRYAPRLARDRLGEELTDVITVCVTWLASLGYDEAERGRIQRAVNEKNHRRGYWG